MSEIRPFLCDSIEKPLLRGEWEKWLRSFKLYLDAEDIKDSEKNEEQVVTSGWSSITRSYL